MTTDNLCFYLQNRLIQTSQTGGTVILPPLVFPALISDTSPSSIPCTNCRYAECHLN
jgi:hypothetical protein